jgi:hypothetical protein
MSGRLYCEPFVKKEGKKGKPTVYGYLPSVIYETDNTRVKIWSGFAKEDDDHDQEKPKNMFRLSMRSEQCCDPKFHKKKPTFVMESKIFPKMHFVKIFFKNGVPHHDKASKPALIINMGVKTVNYWYVNGVQSRIGGPSVTGLPRIEYHFGGCLDNYANPNEPSVICANREEYWKHGMKHRDYRSGPAIVYKKPRKSSNNNDDNDNNNDRSDDFLSKEEYWHYNALHRPCHVGPAVVGQKEGDAKYYEHGQLHSTVGPAVKRANGENKYYIRGVSYKNKSDWLNQVNYMKANAKSVKK